MKRTAIICTTAIILCTLLSCSSSVDPQDSSSPPADTQAPQIDATDTVSSGTETETFPASTISGSFSTDERTVTEKDGCFYLNFREGYESASSPSQIGEISFDSMEDFFRVARGLDTSRDALIQSTFSKTENGFLTVDTAHLYTPSLSDGHGRVSGINWSGSSYVFECGGENAPYESMFIKCISIPATVAKQTSIYGWYADVLDSAFETYASTRCEGSFDGVPCESVTHEGSTSTNRYTRLTVQDGERTLTVILSYVLSGQEEQDISTSIPSSVSVRWDDGTNAFEVNVYSPTQQISLDWIRSIRMTAYMPEAVVS